MATPREIHEIFNHGNHKKLNGCSILAGVTIALMLSALLNLLGMGLGLIVFRADADVMSALGTSSIIWLIINGVISMFCGGWVAGRYNGTNPMTGFIHGVLVWSLASLITFIAMTSVVGSLLSGTMSMVGKGIEVASATISQASEAVSKSGELVKSFVPDLKPAADKFKHEAGRMIDQTRLGQTAQKLNASPDEVKERLAKAMMNVIDALENDNINEARNELITQLSELTDMDRSEIQEKINKWINNYNEMKNKITQKAEQAKQKALAASEKAARLIGVLSLLSFFSLLIGAVSAGMGGWFGARANENKA